MMKEHGLRTHHIIWVAVVYGSVRGVYITQNDHMTEERQRDALFKQKDTLYLRRILITI